ncbi:MAG3240 family lipoprotein [Metamycoplasma canadense]|uniref:Lipoprotein n=1 Tax=Metamycoplasma canadense TaxID=29554 RepID=A0A077L7J4_9BACT|nr:hypothetical protein [Metamycoplasma canadense]BAP39796.1 hypothetical protein MCAN360_0778 [Metamycoplasma canadense]
MSKKQLFGILFSASIIGLPAITVSCFNQNKKDVYLDIEKISRIFLNRLTLSQIASIENDFKIFYYFENNKKHNFDSVKIENSKLFLLKKDQWIEYQPDFPVRNNWKQFYTDNANIRIFDSKESSDINNFLNQYSFDDVDSAGTFNDQWFTILSTIYNKDFSRIKDPYFEDLQTIIFRLNQDIENNYSIMKRTYLVNSNKKRTLFSDWIQPQYIQAKSFLSPEHKKQRKIFESILKLYLNKFNVNVKSIEIDWQNTEIKRSYSLKDEYIKFKIKSIKNWNDKDILNEKNKNKTYYLNGFRNYATNGKFGVGLQGLKEKYPLFTDYIENPLLRMDGKHYLTIIDNINHFVKSSLSVDYWNAKGLMYLFNTFKNEIFTINIPDYKKNEDLEYRIIDFEFTDYFDTNQVFKAIVRVFKKDKTTKDYVWLSSNFDDHGHRLKGLIFKNKAPKNLDFNDIYSFKLANKGIPEGIKLEDFVTNDINSAFMQGLNNASNKMNSLFNYWNNDSRQKFDPSYLNNDSYQIKVLNSYINNYLLAYALENKKGITLSGIKRIDINLNSEKNKLGRLYFELNFIGFENPLDFNFKSSNEKNVATAKLYWNYFKGYDKNLDKNNFTLIEFKRN